jgi:hypothetical protein
MLGEERVGLLLGSAGFGAAAAAPDVSRGI